MSTPPVLPLIVMLSDFGLDDWFVGVMKGVIKSICPQAETIDLCHNVPVHSVASGSLMLATAHRYFPEGSIFLAIVDPGVGTSREPVLVLAGGRWFIAPNNGLLNFLLNANSSGEVPVVPECRILSNPEYHLPSPSDTFHGRDIFAPCAAHLASGVPYTQLAPRPTSLYGLPMTAASADRGVIEGNIIHFDHFGNAITNISRELLGELLQPPLPGMTLRQMNPAQLQIRVASHTINGISHTYGDVDLGQPLAYWGSTGHLEIAINRSNAREELLLQLLDKVIVAPLAFHEA